MALALIFSSAEASAPGFWVSFAPYSSALYSRPREIPSWTKVAPRGTSIAATTSARGLPPCLLFRPSEPSEHHRVERDVPDVGDHAGDRRGDARGEDVPVDDVADLVAYHRLELRRASASGVCSRWRPRRPCWAPAPSRRRWAAESSRSRPWAWGSGPSGPRSGRPRRASGCRSPGLSSPSLILTTMVSLQ